MRSAAIALILTTSAVPATAEVAFLGLPLECEPGLNCYIEDYVDADASARQRDYTCGYKSRDGHKGTDFALTSMQMMHNGTNVIAAAPGIVEAIRDGMQDRPYSAQNAADIAGRECGNAVRIRHENGLKTLYCHMRQDRVRVQTGDTVDRGDMLGQVGMSGQSNYPHVHVTVLRDGTRIDPFAPETTESCGTGSGDTLWLDPIAYVATGFYTAGFSTAVPAFADVQSGAARVLDTDATLPLVLYAHFFLAREGDMLTLQATGPDGDIFDHEVAIETPQAQMFRAFGRKAPVDGWPAGRYQGTARLTRDGRVLGVRFTSITVR